MLLNYYKNENGPEIVTSELGVLEREGLYFKDLSRTGELLPCADWRLPATERAKDLAARLSIEEIAGLMVYTMHQHVPCRSGGVGNRNTGAQTYGGEFFEESGAHSWEATDQQKEMVEKGHVRHFLMAIIESPEVAARWTNGLQALAEAQPWAIPMSFASDPRHGAGAETEYKTAANGFSGWPEGEAMASCHDLEICKEGAKTMARELRAMGVTTFLGPQIDLATEPRWMRSVDTFGADLEWNKALTKAFCDAMQTTEGAPDGWGADSVMTMVKHWPGGGTGEGGRDAHYAYGKHAVFPGGQHELHRKPFTEAAFMLDGPTKKAGAVMPYYTISNAPDDPTGEKVGNSYNSYLISELLRGKYAYDGVVCTDWGVADDMPDRVEAFAGKCFGMEEKRQAERVLRLLCNGVDQVAGFLPTETVVEAIALGESRFGKEVMDDLVRNSAERILCNLFRLGLFENPYVDWEKSKEILSNPQSHAAGLKAQETSVVLLKNKAQALPLTEKIKVYVPPRHTDEKINFFGLTQPPRDFEAVPRAILEEYFTVVDAPETADVALVFMDSPDSAGYIPADRAAGGNGYFPISLQYEPYTARFARETSLEGGDPLEDFTNRGYKEKTAVVYNRQDFENLKEMRRIMGEKRVVAVIRMNHACVLSEVDLYADAILAEFGVSKQALLNIVAGRTEPAGRLAVALPRDMDSLEQHCEDTPFDYPVYEDAAGHTYGFGFGLNWSGVIDK